MLLVQQTETSFDFKIDIPEIATVLVTCHQTCVVVTAAHTFTVRSVLHFKHLIGW